MFEQTLLPAAPRGAKGVSFAASVSAQFMLVGLALIAPLYFIEALPLVKLDDRLLRPPMPKLASVELVAVPKAVAAAMRPMFSRQIFAPTRIPPVAQIVDLPDATFAELAPLSRFGTVAGPGLPDAVTERPYVEPPPVEKPKPVEAAPPPKPTGPVKISQGVLLSKLIKQVMPIYPQLAKQARIQGTVKLMGVIAKDGRIINLQVLSGHPLLVGAAADAVKQWLYQPTLLNGEPVEVMAPIDVNFTLSQ